MTLHYVIEPTATAQRPVPLFEDMQREDFLALAAALREFNLYEAAPAPTMCATQVASDVAA